MGAGTYIRNLYIRLVTDDPITIYIVSVFEKPHWRTVLTTRDKAKALDLAKEIGDKVRVETTTPEPKR
jgi:hypothetical protein